MSLNIQTKMDLKHLLGLSCTIIPSILISLSFLYLLLILIIKRGINTTPKSSTSLSLPPGPWKLPIIGSLHHIRTTLPHHAFRRLALEHGPVMLVRLGQVDVLVVSSPEAAREILKSQDLNFCNRSELLIHGILTYGHKDIFLAPYGDYWRWIRKICTVELLTAKRVRSFHFIFKEEISKLITDIYISSSEKPVINLSSMLVNLMNSIITRCAFGSSNLEQQQKEFISVLREFLELLSGFRIADLFPNIKYIGTLAKVNRIHRHLDQILAGLIRQHQLLNRVDEVEDLVGVLLRIKDRDEQEFPITDDNIKAVILDMFSAGTDTSSSTVAWAMSELMRNPGTMEKATAEVRRVLQGKIKIENSDLGELHYLKSVIKETLRLHPPGALIPRQSINECQLDGHNIPARTRVFVNVWALGRDPRYWDDAEEFRPERFSSTLVDFKGANFEFLPFGAGRRICPGMTFAATAMEFTLAQLLLNFNWKLPNGIMPQELDMSETFGLTTARRNDLCLHATPYSH